MIYLDKFLDIEENRFLRVKIHGEANVPSSADLIESVRIAAGSSRRAFASGVPLKLSD